AVLAPKGRSAITCDGSDVWGLGTASSSWRGLLIPTHAAPIDSSVLLKLAGSLGLLARLLRRPGGLTPRLGTGRSARRAAVPCRQFSFGESHRVPGGGRIDAH